MITEYFVEKRNKKHLVYFWQLLVNMKNIQYYGIITVRAVENTIGALNGFYRNNMILLLMSKHYLLNLS